MKEWKMAKKRKKHKASILQSRKECYLCEALNGYSYTQNLQKHHVYGGANRDISEAEGFTVWLCIGHHTGSKEAVHTNAGNMLQVRQDMQRKYEEDHTRQEFMALIGRNYLEEESWD